MPGAMELLRRLTLVVGAPFENLDPAASLLSRTGHHAEAVEFLAKLNKANPWDERVRLRLAQEQLASGVDAAAAQTEATRVAGDPQSAYTDREDAASILRGRGANSLGSAELDLLASGNIAPELGDRPHFYAARLRAADKLTTPEVKERLLRNAVNETPDRDAARAPLFTVLASSGRDRLAISAIEPLLNSNFLQRMEYLNYGEQYASDEGTPSNDDDRYSYIQMESALERVTPQQQAQLTYAVGKAYAKLEEYRKAQQFFLNARKAESSKAARAEIDKSLAEVRETMRRIANNDQRVPLVHAELEQDRVVRPRLVEVARSNVKSPPPSGKAAKGGAQ